MSELLLGPIIEKIINLTFSFTKKKYDEYYGVEGQIEILQSNLSAIAAVLKDAERCCSNSKSEQLVDWLSKLKEAALDVEDTLETYATEAAMREEQRHPAPVVWLSSRLDAAKTIEKIVARIDMISQEKAKFHFSPMDYGGTDWMPQSQATRIGLRETSFLRDTSDTVGREEEKEEVVRWLLSEEESDNNGCLPILPIVGMGGLGKTTLAQLVFNDTRIHKKLDEACHFKAAMWVNVSEDSSVDKILKEMVEILTEMRHDMIPQSSIKSRILEVLDGKRFLLVLDDVWVEKLDWEPIHDFLKLCPKGSKILVTSRNSNVARIMGALHTHTLGKLPEKYCWDLFSKRAFPDGKFSKDLEEMGREIIRRCDFLPLAVKSVAGLLRGNNDISKWQRILRNGIWESDQSYLGNGTLNILPALKLSYDHLPSQLKQCFAYCSIFPKGHMFDKYDLVKLWIAEGYILPSEDDKPEETGGDYFDELLTRSFFQILDIDNKERYKMHDLIQDLAKSVSSACQQVQENKPFSIESTARHVSFLCKDVEKPAIEILKAKKLRTLLMPITYTRDFGQNLDKMFRVFRYMRVLDLSSSNITDLPKSIGGMKLLRYLDLSRTEIRLLPKAICNLCNLQILKLLECLWLQELPRDLGNLKNLRYLELDEIFWHKFSKMPPQVGRLTSLHNFQSFHVSHECGYGIEELMNMNSLEGVLHISKLENSTNANAAMLKHKESITKLILEWSKEAVNPQDETIHERVLNDLEPHHSLQELCIHQYKGSRFPSWVSSGMLQNLNRVTLDHCVSCRILSLGPSPNLKELHIKGMLELVEWPEARYDSLRRLTISKCPQLRELPQIFPNIRVMKIKQCDALKALPLMPTVNFLFLSSNALLEDWSEAAIQLVTRNNEGQNVHINRFSFMDLLELKIADCPRLQKLPQVFFPQKLQISGCTSLRNLPIPQYSRRLQCLELDKCNNSSLIEAIPSTTSLYSLIISNISMVASLPRLPHLPQLQSLYVHNCQDLVSLSNEHVSLQNLTALKLLSISGCQKLTALPEELSKSIEFLSIENCSKLESFPSGNYLASLTSLKDLYVENCIKLKSLPEDGFPTTLQHLCIRGCDLLTPQCDKDAGGRYWAMISQVADVELDQITKCESKPSADTKKGYFPCCFRGK